MIVRLTLIPIRTAACLSSDTQRMALPIRVFCVNRYNAHMTSADTMIVMIVALLMDTPPTVIVWVNRVKGTRGSGPMAGMAWARFSRTKLMAIAVINAVRLVPFLRTGRYARSSTSIPTQAQTITASITAVQPGSPIFIMTGMAK